TGNRPNRICDGNIANPTIDRWFDTSCFVPPTDITGTFGNAGRGIIRGPGSFNIDASLTKNMKFGRYSSEIRVEACNLVQPLFCVVYSRGFQPAQPPAVRQSEHYDRERGRGHDLGDALQPLLLAL